MALKAAWQSRDLWTIKIWGIPSKRWARIFQERMAGARIKESQDRFKRELLNVMSKGRVNA